MKPTTRLTLFAVGAFLLCLPGLFTVGMRWAFVAFIAAGFVVLAIAAIRNGSSRPTTALVLLVATNSSFWLSYGLWRVRLACVGPSPNGGIDAFAGPVALWLVLLLVLLFYEAVVFVRGLIKKQERTSAVFGLLGSAVQVLVTVKTAYALVQGV